MERVKGVVQLGVPHGAVKALVPVSPSDGRGTVMARGWPLRSFLPLGALPAAVPCARLHVKAVLWEWGLAGLAEDAELVAAEIVTNAVQASHVRDPADMVRLWLLSDGHRVLILVWDGSPDPPVSADRTAGDTDERGRGLMLVEAFSSQWSWYFAGEYGGKVVWALLTEAGTGQ